MLPLFSMCCAVERIFMQISLEEGGFLERRRRAINNSGLSPQSPPLFSSSFVVFKDGAARVFHHMRTWAFSRPLCMYAVCTQEAIFSSPLPPLFLFFHPG